MILTKSQFKARALAYLREVEDTGKPLIITDRGKPSIEIRRYRGDQRPPLERLKGSVVEFKDPTEPVAVGDWGDVSKKGP